MRANHHGYQLCPLHLGAWMVWKVPLVGEKSKLLCAVELDQLMQNHVQRMSQNYHGWPLYFCGLDLVRQT